MYGKGSNLRNTCKQLPGNSSSFGSKLPLQTGFDLSHQYNTRDQVGVFPDWRKNIAIIHERNLIRNKMSGIHYKKEQAFVIANALENELFIEASSQEEYMNENTLIERMDSKLKKLTETKCREQADSYTIYTSKTLPPSGLPQPAFQKVYINKSPNFSVSAWQQPESSLLFNYSNVSECNFKQFPMPDSISNTEIKNNVIDDAFGNISKDETILSKDLDTDHMSEEPDPKINDGKVSRNLEETVTRSHSVVYALKDLMSANIEEIVPISDHVKDIRNLEQGKEDHVKDISNLEQGKEAESPNPTVNTVSLTDFFTCDQIMEHIASLRKQFNQSAKIEEQGVDVYKCQLCEIGTLPFAPVPIYCFCCGIRIKRNSYYYYRREEDDTQPCFCTVCYRNSRGGNITFNGTSVSKTDLYKKTNNGEFEEAWVECNKCKSWQHQICALYNDKRDLDNSVEYTCPICRLKEIENGMHVPLPKNAMFGAKDLPSTMLSDHIERRLFKRLMQESEDWAKVEGNKNLDEVLLAENLSVRVVLSVEKQLKVKKQFLDIFVEENYPAEFPYTSKVILLFQQIEGVDVCLFAMYVQEFGSECGNPNKRSVYISYLDSVKYFRPQRATMNGEALRTFVYHEILIGYLDFCKKRGFKTCYIWACPPIKGEDYILYCHPDTQKTPKNDKLRHWYLSMLRKAAEENIVVGLTNIYDNFFVSTRNWNSKVTAAHLPYFDGDFWSGAAMDKARIIDQECGGDYEKMKKLMTKRTLKTMGHVNPSKGTAKDILVMQKLGQTILPFKEDFIVVQLQYVCMHCHEVIMSGKRWFCTATECKTFQECQRCHTANSHTSRNGEKHTLRQVFMDDILCDTKENDVILDNGLFDTRHNLLSFCQRNSLQFDSLRRAKYSSMMILYFLKNPNLLNVGTICRVCNKQNVYQCHWKCQNCPEFTVCSACYNKKGANCHAHTLTQTFSTALSPSGNQELNQNSALELQDVIKHASQCHSTKTQPCTYPHCLQLKKLFSHASRCTIRVSGGCQYCKKVWVALSVHSRNCRDSGCQIPRCMDLKKHAEWIATQSESRRRAAVLEATANSHPH
ncbi:histone acetyltransferase HAC12 [Cajanus cajan]|uniref:histone acetyltransferase HAC12 n=1 Tax=Cajanus cajan TaxID=3821 RepID=UPI00098D7EB2|nr:histone acetyltransferase HAC12 [Cajanus cajan]